MNVLFVNACNYGSTGNMVNSLCELLKSEGANCLAAFPKTKENKNHFKEGQFLFGNKFSRNLSSRFCSLFGNHKGLFFYDTYCLLRTIKRFKPDIIHLHNLHGNYLNIRCLFSYINKNHIPVVWTFHDCWPFTGRCPHFIIIGCEKWKSGCYECPYPKKEYPAAMVDKTKQQWKKKKRFFTSVDNLTVVTPSKWLSRLVGLSFFKDKKIQTINNGIDLNVFKPKESNFRCKNHLENKIIVLGVAFDWGYKKGLDVFIELASALPKQYQIVLVGTNEAVDEQLPLNIISIHKTSNKSELAELYSSADVFFNPTREENYPTVNMEAIACGTPVVTFETGGSPEIVTDKTGIVIKSNSVDESVAAIRECCEKHLFKKEDCLERAKNFNEKERFKEYLNLYKNIEKR